MKRFVISLNNVVFIKAIGLTLSIVIICYRLAQLIVNPSPYIWLLFASAPVLFVLLKKNELGIYVIMFSVFFSDWALRIGYIPAQLTWLPELVILVYFVKFFAEKRKFMRTPIDVPIIIFIVIGMASTLINSSNFVSTGLAFRLDLKFVLMFYILVSLGLEEYKTKRMIGVITALLIIQVPVAYYKYTIYGHNELAVGTYTHGGGALSTILPLFAISLFVGFYLFHDSRPRYLLFILGYLFYPILSNKRGFIFYGIFLLFFLMWQARHTLNRKLILVAVVMIPGILASLFLVTTWRNVLENPRFLYDYTMSYTQQRTSEGEAGGRASAIKEAYRSLSSDPIHFAVGRGPGTTIKSFFSSYSKQKDSVNIVYGFTHLVSTAIDYGYLGLFFYLILPMLILFRWNRGFFISLDDRYWKAVSYGFGGMIFSSVLIGLFYAELFRWDVTAFLFWFFAAVLYSKYTKMKKSSVSHNVLE